MAFPPVIGVPEALPTCKVYRRSARMVPEYCCAEQGHGNVASNPGDIEKRVAFFHGVCTPL